MPSVLAVFMLMTSSNFVGCSMGMSFGCWAFLRVTKADVHGGLLMAEVRPLTAVRKDPRL